MKNYSFEFVMVEQEKTPVPTTPTTPNIPTAPDTNTSAGAKTKGQEFAQGTAQRLTGVLEQQTLAPLNQVTGGMATPVYNVGKSIVAGASAGAIGGAIVGLVISAIQLAVNKIEQRVAQNEAKAAELNERDNLLIKSGAKTTATFYEGNFNGVQSVERNFN